MRLRDLCVSPSADEFSIRPLTVKACGGRRLLHVFPALLVLLATIAAQAQQYTKIVVFGDSLSDTGNDLIVFATSNPPILFPYPLVLPPPLPTYALNYTVGRFTDGSDTTPAAVSYHGVWIEQLAAALPAHPAVFASLEGGADYAYGFADTFNGQTVFNITGTPYTANVNNIGLQIDDYLATNPQIDNHTLFVVWGGANNLTEAVPESNAAQLIVNGAVAQIGNVQRLINAGATQFLVANLPNLGSVPRFNTSPTDSVAFNKASVLYNATLDAGVSLLPLLNFGRRVTIYRFDVYSLLKNVVGHPSNYGLVNVTDSSQGEPVDPDTFLFWDDLHPTTHGHNVLGMTALKLIEPAGCVQQVSPGEFVGVAAPGCR
jgi:phospholipase/lecithinase/hemolysin